MATKAEKFRGQIENFLEQRLDQPEYSEKQIAALRILKGEILKIISRRERRFLQDLALNDKEFGTIFEELEKSSGDLLKQVGVFGVEDFEQLMGIKFLYYADYMEQAWKVELFGIKVKVIPSLRVNKRTMGYYQKAVERINQHQELRPYINGEVELMPGDDGRLEFVIIKAGKSVKYCANYEKVLRVEIEFPVEKKRELINKRIELARLKQLLKIDPSMAEKVNALQAVVWKLEAESSRRSFFDEELKMAVEEYNNPGEYSWTYFDEKAFPIKRTLYTGIGKLSEAEFELGDYYERSTLFFREDGTRHVIDSGKIISFFDAGGENIVATARMGRSGKFFDNRLMVANGGKETIGSFADEKLKDSLLTEDQYMAKFKRVVGSREQYNVFEELFFAALHDFPESLVKKIRAYGKEVTGLNKLEEKFFKKYGIKIHTEDFGVFGLVGKGGELAAIEAIEKAVFEIGSMIDIYPPGFVNRFVNRIYLVANIDENHVAGKSFFADIVMIVPLQASIFHHELFHSIEAFDGLFFDDYDWALAAHGGDYESQYGSVNPDELVAMLKDGNFERLDGFVSLYAKYGGSISEDQAETARVLMVNDPVLESLKREPALRKKVHMIKDRFYLKSNGMMDKQFWKDLRNGVKIDRKYWRERIRKKPIIQNSRNSPDYGF